MKDIKAIIVEYELLERQQLRYLIETNSNIQIVKECSDGLQVLEFIQNHKVDLIFLDINIPKLDGILLTNIINNFKYKPKIIFTTADECYAAKAYSLNVYDYILKPYSKNRLIALFDKIENDFKESLQIENTNIEDLSSKLSLWKGDKIVVIDVKEIYYCEANKKTTYIHTEKDIFEVREGISHVEEIINNNIFYRCHRSYLVNLIKIGEIIPWGNNAYIIKLKNNHELEVSRSKVKEFRKLMHI